MIIKTCIKCNECKPIYLFNKQHTNVERYTNVCKDCINRRNKELRLIRGIKLSLLKQKNNNDHVKLKICSKCKTEKPYTTEYFVNTTRDGLSCDCKECRNKKNREYQKLKNEALTFEQYKNKKI